MSNSPYNNDPYGQVPPPGSPNFQETPHPQPSPPAPSQWQQSYESTWQPEPQSQPSAYEQQSGHQEPNYRQYSAYDQPAGHGQQNYGHHGYGQQGYGQQPYGQAQNYGGQQPYGAPTGYGAPQQGYGTQPYGYAPPAAYPSGKSKMAAGLLGVLLGTLGIHNFYLGHTGKGLIQLLITVLSFGMLAFVSTVWGIVEGVLIITAQPNSKWAYDAKGGMLS